MTVSHNVGGKSVVLAIIGFAMSTKRRL